ncbi:MAG: alpha-1,2-fucosyltransferase [Chloroflexota bacterium]
MILRGDFGNQLFQYAVGRRLALQHDTDLVLNVSNRLSIGDWRGAKLINKLSYLNLKAQFQYWPPLITRLWHKLHLSRLLNVGTYFPEKQWGYDPDVLALPDHTYLYGYFQSEQYFRGIAPIIQADLYLDLVPISNTASAVLMKIKNSESVSIHVRRGDFLQMPDYQVCSQTYYANAIAFIRQRLEQPHFFVFSDDPGWCKANLHFDNTTFVTLPPSCPQPIYDFWLMQQCQHNIIANSTFSWWAAWLNCNPNKMVIAPNRWSRREPLNQLALKHTLPTEWIRVAV